jgi:hypothetical protein
VLRPRVPFSQALAPWAVAALVSLGVWGVANRRGLELDLADVQVRVPPPHPEEPDWLRERRSEVEALRDDVRRGTASLDSYLRARRALAAAAQRSDAGSRDRPVD